MVSRTEKANALRALSMDAVQQANSGHPGMPMGMADIAEVLWNDFLNHNPLNPNWINRDRFILSNGHGSMLQYALLHLTGYAVSINDLKQFRQLHSNTPGHPELGETPGVEVTTGPLGQGLGNAVGMALAQSLLAHQFNQPNFTLIDHFTYCFVGDGCLMEGISHEVASLAGTLGLGKLIVFWDDNGISIDGKVDQWFTDNTPQRFESYNWHVIDNIDGHQPEAIKKAIITAQQETKKPSLLCCKTIIGFGAPNLQGTADCHGAPLGDNEITAAKKQLNWPYQPFEIPKTIYQAWDQKTTGAEKEKNWQTIWSNYQQQFPTHAQELLRRTQQQLPDNWQSTTKQWLQEAQNTHSTIATRKASQIALNKFSSILPELIGGSADLSGSNLTQHDNSLPITTCQPKGNYIYYGVREFGMAAIMNGLSLHSEFIPYGGTFLTFADYARNGIRMSALMAQRLIYVFTHDSIGLGEDGPTHQPIEHLTMLRATPNVSLWRPCDSVETQVAWQMAIERTQGPTCLALTRQKVPHQKRDTRTLQQIYRGAYILSDTPTQPEAIIIATGSEVAIAQEAASELAKLGHEIRVVSMPSIDVFLSQDPHYRESVLPKAVKSRVAVEAGATLSWHQFISNHGRIVGIDCYGLSAPGDTAYKALGITKQAVIQAVQEVLTQEAILY